MIYRKKRTQHDEISLRLTYSTYHNTAEKKKSNVYQPHSNNIHQLYNKEIYIYKATLCCVHLTTVAFEK